MSQHGAALQNYNQELVKCLEELKIRRIELQKEIEEEEEEKKNIQREIEKLSNKLSRLNESLSKKTAVKSEFDRAVTEAEGAYSKIVESSELLLNMLKKELSTLEQNLEKASVDKQKKYRQ